MKNKVPERIVLFCFVILTWSCKQENLKFNSALWKSGDRIQKGKMINDLLTNIELTNKSKKEIGNLLGEPEDSIEYRYYYEVDREHWYINDLIIFFDSTTVKSIDFILD